MEDGEKIVKTAIDNFGRLGKESAVCDITGFLLLSHVTDILVNNAG